MGWGVGVVVVDLAITDPISGPSLSFVFCLLALSLTINYYTRKVGIDFILFTNKCWDILNEGSHTVELSATSRFKIS